jgi:6-phospho-3-hexuloisomerase
LTIYPKAAIGSMASSIIWINAPTAKSRIDTGTVSIQPMGSLFEQSLLICMDHIILRLMEKIGITAGEMFKKHANLE